MDGFLRLLSAVGAAQRRPTVTSALAEQPEFYWVFKNMDFEEWVNSYSDSVLWLSGPPERRLALAASYIVELERKRGTDTPAMVLYFSCSFIFKVRERSIITTFVHTLLHQIIRWVKLPKKVISAVFFHTLFDQHLQRQRNLAKAKKLPEDDYHTLPKLLDANERDQIHALLSVLRVQQPTDLSIIIDGLYMVVPHGDQLLWERFIEEISAFIANLRGSGLNVRILLTSLPQSGALYSLRGISGHCIEYDKERKGSITPLSFCTTLTPDVQNVSMLFASMTHATAKSQGNTTAP